ncbi:MAG: META domain-containing protein [Micromonosporaceae bacterium]
MKPMLILALLALAVATGCGQQQPAGSPKDKAEELPTDRTYVSSKVTGHALVEGSRIRLEFTKSDIKADAGCNHFQGKASLQGGRLVVDKLGGTEMGCDKPLMTQEEWLTDFLTSSPVLQLDGETLVLSDGKTKIELREEQPTALAGTKWTLDTLVDGQTASSVPAGVKAHLTFGDDGKVTGNAGCNQLGGSYTTAQDTITFANIGVTRMACGGEKDTVEKSVLAVLDGEVTYRVEGQVLTLEHPSGKGLQLRAG